MSDICTDDDTDNYEYMSGILAHNLSEFIILNTKPKIH